MEPGMNKIWNDCPDFRNLNAYSQSAIEFSHLCEIYKLMNFCKSVGCSSKRREVFKIINKYHGKLQSIEKIGEIIGGAPCGDLGKIERFTKAFRRLFEEILGNKIWDCMDHSFWNPHRNFPKCSTYWTKNASNFIRKYLKKILFLKNNQ